MIDYTENFPKPIKKSINFPFKNMNNIREWTVLGVVNWQNITTMPVVPSYHELTVFSEKMQKKNLSTRFGGIFFLLREKSIRTHVITQQAKNKYPPCLFYINSIAEWMENCFENFIAGCNWFDTSVNRNSHMHTLYRANKQTALKKKKFKF